MELTFKDFKAAVRQQFEKMEGGDLFHVGLDKDIIWDTYLQSYPEGTNPVFRERTEHDCSACKKFIRDVGSIVTIKGKKLVSVWDIKIGGHYQIVADAMSELVKRQDIVNVFRTTEKRAGINMNHETLEDGKVLDWEHFCVNIPNEYVLKSDQIGPMLSQTDSSYKVFVRSLDEVTMESLDIVLELIDQNSLYRGEEHKHAVSKFKALKVKYDKLSHDARSLFCWSNIKGTPTSVLRIRNTSIGTLLIDISEGVELDRAVASFEAKVAPTNYKRPTAVVTQRMIKDAQDKVEELGFTSALARRHAVTEDITVNNVLFANRNAKTKMKGANVFDDLMAKTSENVQSLDKVEEIHIEAFLEDILPQVSSIQLMIENKHAGNLVSLIAPVDEESLNMFKWGNNFSWAYAGEVADSIKQRVKAAGGDVTGDVRCSLSWDNLDDLDLHMKEPAGVEIYYGSKLSRITGGWLDVDMNISNPKRGAVENITYPDFRKMRAGDYQLSVHNYTRRDQGEPGFEIEMEIAGTLYNMSYVKAVKAHEHVEVATIAHDGLGNFKVKGQLASTQIAKEYWGLTTQSFHEVSMLMYSPNYWDEKSVGNRHYFFMLSECENDEGARGFFNEFLTSDLDKHRKVFEMVGSKMRVAPSDRQLSGLGFSSTQRNHVYCKVAGNFSRTIKLIF